MLPDEIGYAMPAAERPGLLARLVKLNRYLLLLLLIPLGLIFFWPPYQEQEHARLRLDQLELQRDAFQDKAARLRKKLELIRTDPAYLETMARDRLHLQKDGEVILRFEE